jgi:hypothetical protein
VNRDDTARIWVAAKVLERMIKGRRGPADTDLREHWAEGDKLTVRLTDGTVLGAVTMCKGRTTAAVTDETALTAWVQDRFPHEIVPQVRPSFVELLLLSAKNRDGCWVNRKTGEAVPIPGVKVGYGDPYPAAHLAEDAEQVLAVAWERREMNPGELLALPQGGGGDG